GGLGTHGQAPVMIVCWRIHSSTCECRHLYTSGSSQP
ncbi:monooxygenase, partial [Pseudomonas aeruginosa]